MKKIITVIAFLSTISASAQAPITANGFKFKQGNNTFSFKEMGSIVQDNKLANQKYWEARTMRTNSLILAGFGAIGIGIPVYTVVKQRSISWFFTRYTMPLMAGGIICEVAAIKKSTKSKRYASEAAAIYNSGIKTSFIQNVKERMTVGIALSGPRLQIKF